MSQWRICTASIRKKKVLCCTCIEATKNTKTCFSAGLVNVANNHHNVFTATRVS